MLVAYVGGPLDGQVQQDDKTDCWVMSDGYVPVFTRDGVCAVWQWPDRRTAADLEADVAHVDAETARGANHASA